MATSKVTFTLDRETVARIDESAEILEIPKSQVVRKAVENFRGSIDRLSQKEIERRLRVLDEFIAKVPPRPHREVLRELKAIRDARRGGGRRTRVD
jgi:predicted transcriptional regulator